MGFLYVLYYYNTVRGCCLFVFFVFLIMIIKNVQAFSTTCLLQYEE